MQNEPEEFSPPIRDAFDAYPRPVGDAEFDARFWRELEARRNRYCGVSGLLRRLIEVEIEGIAVWRLGFALFGGAATCAIGVALLSLSSSPATSEQRAPLMAETPRDSLSSPRLARELWDERAWEMPVYAAPTKHVEKPKAKEEISCVSFARDLV